MELLELSLNIYRADMLDKNYHRKALRQGIT